MLFKIRATAGVFVALRISFRGPEGSSSTDSTEAKHTAYLPAGSHHT